MTAMLLPAARPGAFYTHPGFWLALAMALLMFVNAARAAVDPAGFASYMGLPVQDATSLAWVQVYGLRALFIGLVVAFLLLRLDAGSLKWLAGFALVMSFGDAWLVHVAGGTSVARHLVTSAVLVAAALALHRWDLSHVRLPAH